jgi:hypothetical protein
MILESRRGIMKLLGLVPAVASGGAAQLAALVASPAVKVAAAAGSLAGGASGNALEAPQPTGSRRGRLGEVLGRQIHKLRQQHDDQMWVLRHLRPPGGFDADIDALRSVSRVNKARKQFERDAAGSDLIRQAESFMYDN